MKPTPAPTTESNAHDHPTIGGRVPRLVRLYVLCLCHFANWLFDVVLWLERLAIGKELLSKYKSALSLNLPDVVEFLADAKLRSSIMPGFSSPKQTLARMHNQIKRLNNESNA